MLKYVLLTSGLAIATFNSAKFRRRLDISNDLVENIFKFLVLAILFFIPFTEALNAFFCFGLSNAYSFALNGIPNSSKNLNILFNVAKEYFFNLVLSGLNTPLLSLNIPLPCLDLVTIEFRYCCCICLAARDKLASVRTVSPLSKTFTILTEGSCNLNVFQNAVANVSSSSLVNVLKSNVPSLAFCFVTRL